MSSRRRGTWGVLLAIGVAGCYLGRSPSSQDDGASKPSVDASVSRARERAPLDAGRPKPRGAVPEPNLRIAFIGDQSMGKPARDVLRLIQREGAALVVHAGDLSYGLASAPDWEKQIDDVLGPDFPYLVAAGNHDLDDWEGPEGYAAILNARLTRTPQVQCQGEQGLKALCRFRGVDLVLSGVGTSGSDHEPYLERALSRSDALVRLCVWHKNQKDLQVGDKVDEVGWAAYQICQRHGAAIITGHEHSYARTFTLTRVGERQFGHGVVGPPDSVRLAPGSTFVVVSGLGGHSSRARTHEHVGDTWWASIYANTYQQKNSRRSGELAQVEFGALFIDFHVDGDPGKARAYFKTVSGQVVDKFEIRVEH